MVVLLDGGDCGRLKRLSEVGIVELVVSFSEVLWVWCF